MRTMTAIRIAVMTAVALPLAPYAPEAMAQSATSSDFPVQTLEVPVNKSRIVTSDRPIAQAMISDDHENKDERIADVVAITERKIHVLGKKMGTTTLTLYDHGSRVISVIDVAVGPDVEALRDQLGQLVPGETIDARITHESIVLSGIVNSAGAADRAVQLAKAFAGDKVVNLLSVGSSQQVMLEVRFAEVSRSTGHNVGINGAGVSRNGKFSAVTGRGSSFTPGVGETSTTVTIDPDGNTSTTISTESIASLLGLGAITDSFGIFRRSFNIGNVNIDAMLNALETRGLAKTLAQPTLIALSGERASFLAGGEFPIPVVQGSGGSTNLGGQTITVEFKPFGVSLGFTPTVLGDKTISMIVEPEVSSIDPTASITLGSLSIPGLRTRRASTTLELRDGESFAIAGLLSRDFKTTVDQLPLLGSIPILGALFRSSSYQKGETELLIVVTPRLVAPIKPGQVRLPTDRVKDPTAIDTILLGQPYQTKPLPPATAEEPAAQAPAGSSPSPQTSLDLPAKDSDYAY